MKALGRPRCSAPAQKPPLTRSSSYPGSQDTATRSSSTYSACTGAMRPLGGATGLGQGRAAGDAGSGPPAPAPCPPEGSARPPSALGLGGRPPVSWGAETSPSRGRADGRGRAAELLSRAPGGSGRGRPPHSPWAGSTRPPAEARAPPDPAASSLLPPAAGPLQAQPRAARASLLHPPAPTGLRPVLALPPGEPDAPARGAETTPEPWKSYCSDHGESERLARMTRRQCSPCWTPSSRPVPPLPTFPTGVAPRLIFLNPIFSLKKTTPIPIIQLSLPCATPRTQGFPRGSPCKTGVRLLKETFPHLE